MRRRSFLLTILTAGVILRIVYIIQLGRSDIGRILPLDMDFYFDLAARINSGGGLKGTAISFNPLYPFILSAITGIFGRSLLWPRIIQAVTGLATIGLIFFSGRFLGRRSGNVRSDGYTTGLIAAAAGLLYPQFLLYEGALLATVFVTFIAAASFAVALLVDSSLRDGSKIVLFSRPLPVEAAASLFGILLGAGALGRPNLFFPLILMLPLRFLISGTERKRSLRTSLLCVAGIIIMILPSAVYNAAQTGKFVPVTTHGGINFYIGNRPEATGIYDPPDGMRSDMRGLIEDAGRIAERESNRGLSMAEVSDYWFGRSKEWILTDPVGFARLLARKFVLFWNGAEVSDIVEISAYREECWILRLLILPYSIISVFAFAGFCFLFIGGRNRSIPSIFLLAALASIMFFYINTRYRIPSVPVLIVMAAFGVTSFADWVRGGRWKRATAVAVVGSSLSVPMAAVKTVAIDRSASYTFLGNHYMEEGEYIKGEKAFARAYDMAPQQVMTNINYARALLKQGKLDQARRFYSSAFNIDPDFPLLAVEYGSLLEQVGDRDEAAKAFLYAYRLDFKRDRLLACQFLSRLEYEKGDIPEAIEWIKKGLELAPGDEKLSRIMNELIMEINDQPTGLK
ncbi:MAG: tetratricopeptide repeat protein [Candidatus Krumholzibacteriota bacterium]|nr:tetratricopeptide repeat protein [Candidatus Krumholzibacteriota bacterium]